MRNHRKQNTSPLAVPAAEYAARRARFISNLKPNSVAIFVSNPESTRSNDTEFKYRQSSNILYLTGFPEQESALVLTNIKGVPSYSLLVLPKDPLRETWTGRRYGVDGAKKVFGAKAAYSIEDFSDVVRRLITKSSYVYYKPKRNPKFDRLFATARSGKKARRLDPEPIVNELRLFKSATEIAHMQKAGTISAAAHVAAMSGSRSGVMEYQLQALLEGLFTFNGADAPAYGSIVAGGNNAVILHYTRNSDSLNNGDLILIDAACEYKGYASDITRTYPVNGRFTKAQREIYELVLQAQLEAIKAAKPGIQLAEMHNIACKVLLKGLIKFGILPASATVKQSSKSKGGKKPLVFTDVYMHGTSHWIGLDVHDVGNYKFVKGKGKTRMLEPGMCFTVEPGLYFDANDTRVPKQYRGIGVRIEDDVLITKTGYRILTDGVPKSVKEIERLVGTLKGKPTLAGTA